MWVKFLRVVAIKFVGSGISRKSQVACCGSPSSAFSNNRHLGNLKGGTQLGTYGALSRAGSLNGGSQLGMPPQSLRSRVRKTNTVSCLVRLSGCPATQVAIKHVVCICVTTCVCSSVCSAQAQASDPPRPASTSDLDENPLAPQPPVTSLSASQLVFIVSSLCAWGPQCNISEKEPLSAAPVILTYSFEGPGTSTMLVWSSSHKFPVLCSSIPTKQDVQIVFIIWNSGYLPMKL